LNNLIIGDCFHLRQYLLERYSHVVKMIRAAECLGLILIVTTKTCRISRLGENTHCMTKKNIMFQF